MPINVGSVVWLNSGQGPYTVTALEKESAVCTRGDQSSLQTIPIAALSTTDPSPRIEDDRKTEADRILLARSSNSQPTDNKSP